MSDLITDLRVINGGWRASLRDGTTIEVTDKEVAWAGCAQDAVMIKARDRNMEPTFASGGYVSQPMDFIYCGLAASAYADAYELLVDAGDLDEDPLPAHRAGAGRMTMLDGRETPSPWVKVIRVVTGDPLADLAYADATKGYVIALTTKGHWPPYARIDGIALRIERA